MNLESLQAEIHNLRLDMEYLSGVSHAQSLAIRELLKATPHASERIAKYISLAEGTDHGGGFSQEQLKAIDMTLKTIMHQKSA